MRHHAPRTFVVVSLLAFAVASPLVAIAADGAYAPAESAAVARAEWAAMRKARAAGDLPTALRHAARAHDAWPGQWVYAYGLASVAAAAGDSQQVARGLGDLAVLGATPDLARDTTLVRFARAKLAASRLPSLFANVATSTGPRDEIAVQFPPADSAFWPEGIAYDPVGDALFVTGVREGRIARVDSGGHVHPFARVAPTGWSALGVAVDPRANRVWVGAAALPQATGYVAADSGRGAVLAFDRTTGKEVARFDLPPAPEGHVPGDVLVTPEGDVYISDSGQPAIWLVRGGKLERFAGDPGFRSLQGQALSPDGRRLYVADYSHGLAVIDLESRGVTWLRPPAGGTVLGIDGLVAHPLGLLAVQNGIVPPRLVGIEIDESGAAPRLVQVIPLRLNPDQADEPTLVTSVVDRRKESSGRTGAPRLDDFRAVFIANSQWEKYDERGTRRPGTNLVAPTLLFARDLVKVHVQSRP